MLLLLLLLKGKFVMVLILIFFFWFYGCLIMIFDFVSYWYNSSIFIVLFRILFIYKWFRWTNDSEWVFMNLLVIWIYINIFFLKWYKIFIIIWIKRGHYLLFITSTMTILENEDCKLLIENIYYMFHYID